MLRPGIKRQARKLGLRLDGTPIRPSCTRPAPLAAHTKLELMPNRFLQKFVPHHEPPSHQQQNPPPAQPDQPLPSTDKILITSESVVTNTSEASRMLTSGDVRQNSKELTATSPSAGGVAATGKLRSLGRGSSGGGRFARIRGLLPSSKSTISPSISGTPPPGPAPVSGAGFGAIGERSSATGSVASCSGTAPSAEQERSQESVDVGVGGAGRPSRVLPRRQKSSNAHDKAGRWWAACLAPPRLRAGDPAEQAPPAGVMLDTAGSACRPPDMLTTMDVGGQGLGPNAQPQCEQGPQHHHHQHHQQMPGAGGAGGGADGSVGSSGQADPERFNRFKKSSGRHLRVSLERNLQNKATRNGSGPGGMACGGPGSAVFSTIDSKPRDSFESDWDVMGAENDGNALSVVGVAMSTHTGLDGNSGGINVAGGGGSRGPTALMAAVAAAMANASSGGGGGRGGGSEAANSGRQQSNLRKGPTPTTTPRKSHDYHENTEPGDQTDQLQQQQQGRQAQQTPPRQQQQQQRQGVSDAGESIGDGDGGGRERLPRGSMMRSPTSSSNMPVDLSFNPNLHHITPQRAAGPEMVPAAVGGAQRKHFGGLAGSVAAAAAGSGGRGRGIGNGGAGGGYDNGTDCVAGSDAGGEGSSRNGRRTPEDLLAAQMMALQNRINALTDEDLLNPSAKLPFVSPSPSQAVQALPSTTTVNNATSPMHHLPPSVLAAATAANAAAPLPYQLASSGSDAGLGIVAALRAGSSANLTPSGLLLHPQQSYPPHPPHLQHNSYMTQQHQHQHQQGSLQHPSLMQQHHHNAQYNQQHQHQHHQHHHHNPQQQYQQYQQHQVHGGLQPHQAQASLGLPPLSGMGALDALSAFLGSPPSRGASIYDGGGGILMTTGATAGGNSGIGPRASAGSPGSIGAGGGAGSSARSGGTAAAAAAAVAAAGIRSMQSINEDGFLAAAVNQTGGSSYRLASSHLGGMGAGPASNSSFLSMRPGPGPGSDDPGGMLFTRDDTGVLGPSSRGHAGLARSSDTDMMQPNVKNTGSPANMIFFTRGSSLGDRHSLLGAGALAGPGGVAGGGGGGVTGGAGTGAAAPAVSQTPARDAAAGLGASPAAPGADSSSPRNPLPPITAPPAGAGGAGGGRFTLAAALSPFQEELMKAIVPPVPGIGGALPGSATSAASVTTGSVGSAATASRQLPPPASGKRSVSSNAAAADGNAPPGSGWGTLPAGAGTTALTAAALGRGGGWREPGSSNGVASSTGTIARVSLRRGAGGTASSLLPHFLSDNPEVPNSAAVGNPHQFLGGGGGGGQQLPHGHGTGLPHHYPQAHLNQQQLAGGAAAAAAAPTGMGTAVSPALAAGRSPRPSGEVPGAGFRRHSTDYLYDEFFSNGPLQYDMITQALAGGPSSGPGFLPSSSSPLESADASMAAAGGGAATAMAAHGRGGAGPPPPPPLGQGGVGMVLGPAGIPSRSVRRNVSAESLRIQAAHRSMEGRVAAAVAGGAAGAGAVAATHHTNYSGNHVHVQGAVEGLSEPTLGQATPEVAAAAAAAVAVAAAAAASASSTATTTTTTAAHSTNGANPGSGRAYGGGQRGGVPSANGSSNGTVGSELQPPTVLPSQLTLAGGGGGGGSGLFLDGTAGTRHPLESARAAAAAAVAATAGATNSPDMINSGGLTGQGLSSTDAVVAGLMESVLRSGATTALQDNGVSSGQCGGIGGGDGAAAAAAAQGLAILPGVPSRTVLMGTNGGGAAAAAAAATAAAAFRHTTSGASRVQQQGPDRPGSCGTVTTGTSAVLSGSGATSGIGAVSGGAVGGGGGASGGSSPSLEALMAFRDESGQPLLIELRAGGPGTGGSHFPSGGGGGGGGGAGSGEL
ncbi:hypothetical protein VOLCADRAFT_96194 [Volvox carteri f. nagariensis]|uniref:Uncharacterized protein n=1 Tax=Volvox carteri f. nagariensis TaxID=3068 RepID=D8U9G7_VOLCA|nr:uncharacterized protein VOLCADRAFT_96194 [Volvox carteri f. nagariensis]EFJ43637.1 hypothetical protein VOLCADRAFT_96194 [Volvox carteri f. nagariensis]|eukprot:XP_002955337.1 hypothetical protein VOLCADRAFT_96194 [Volvox carteri f. nagariensis]